MSYEEMSEKHDAMWGAAASEYIAQQEAEIARLQRERDDFHARWEKQWRENEKLRTALEAINAPFDQTMTGLEIANLQRTIARKALAEGGNP